MPQAAGNTLSRVSDRQGLGWAEEFAARLRVRHAGAVQHLLGQSHEADRTQVVGLDVALGRQPAGQQLGIGQTLGHVHAVGRGCASGLFIAKAQLQLGMLRRQGHYMKAAMLQSQFATLEEPVDAFTVDISQTPQQIVDAVLAHLASGTGLPS